MLLRARFSVSLVDTNSGSPDGFDRELASFTLDREPHEALLDFIDRIDVEEDRIRAMLESMETRDGTPEGLHESGGTGRPRED